MAREGEVNVPVDEGQGGDDGTTNGVHEVNAHEFQNMRLSIGTPGRIMLDIPLTENLNDTRIIDVHLRQGNGPQAAGAGAGAELEPVPAPVDAAPAIATPAPADAGAGHGGRLKITVAAERDVADDKEYLDKMRGWLMTVATLFVSMAFQAMLHPPDWLFPSSAAADHQQQHDAASAKMPFYRYWRAASYLISNVLTFGTSLTLVVVLLQETPSARRTLTTVTAMVCVVSGSLAATFALATSKSRSVVHAVYIFIVVYESYIAGRVSLGREPIGYMVARLVGRCWVPNSVVGWFREPR